MKLRNLLQKLDYKCVCGSLETEISKICCDSRQAVSGCLFVCIKGTDYDGHDFAIKAVESGAAALVTDDKEALGKLSEDLTGTTVIQVESARFALAYLAAAFFKEPAGRLTTIGITGTKGKTTTAYLIRSVLEQAGLRTGLIGTIETIIGKERIPAVNTTPESLLLQEYLFRMAEAGMDAVVMEVSSQGLKMCRTEGFIFDYGIFTNLGEDHIGPGEHENMEEYIACKSLLFRQCRVGIINCDDPLWQKVVRSHTCRIETYGFGKNADYQVRNYRLYSECGALSTEFEVKKQGIYYGYSFGRQEDGIVFQTSTPGKFSVYNGLAAIAICDHFGVDPKTVQAALKNACVKGRMEIVETGKDYTILIDYAHNAMSLKSLLETLREYKPARLVCLFGCGGNRSGLRRLEMGEVSGQLADYTILTSDNPRYEEPEKILQDIEEGMIPTGGAYIVICDRREAIAYGIKNARPGDILVLAGKGHEEYQEIKGKKYPMDERKIIRGILEKEPA